MFVVKIDEVTCNRGALLRDYFGRVLACAYSSIVVQMRLRFLFICLGKHLNLVFLRVVAFNLITERRISALELGARYLAEHPVRHRLSVIASLTALDENESLVHGTLSVFSACFRPRRHFDVFLLVFVVGYICMVRLVLCHHHLPHVLGHLVILLRDRLEGLLSYELVAYDLFSRALKRQVSVVFVRLLSQAFF